MHSFEHQHRSELDWYNRAKAKAESFLREIDPSLRVEILPVTIRPRGKDAYHTLALGFASASDPRLNWTMEIESSDQYINEQLESVVRQIYHDRREELT